MSATVLVIDDSPTILKVVQLILSKAGFEVITAHDGEDGLEKAKRHLPALILLDFVMPVMNGYQVCRELSRSEKLKDISVVLMSAKGDQVGDRFVRVMGIVDYITKPFSPEALTAVVQHTIDKYSAKHTDDSDPMRDNDADSAEHRPPNAPAARHLDTHRIASVDRIRRCIRTAIIDVLATENDGTIVDAVTGAVARALTEPVIDNIIATVESAAASGPGHPSLVGDLRVVPVAEVLSLLSSQHQSGVLTVECDPGAIRISFRNGRIDLVTGESIDDEFLLGRYLLDEGVIKVEELERFIESRGNGATLMGHQLVALGYLSPAQLAAALARQSRELIYEALRWKHGRFSFTRTAELPEPAIRAALALDVSAVLMDGFRRVDEWHLIEREVDDFDAIFLRNEDAVRVMGKQRLTRDELSVLELVNGRNTVKDIIRMSRMGSFEVTKMLYRLLSVGLIRPRVQPVVAS